MDLSDIPLSSFIPFRAIDNDYSAYLPLDRPKQEIRYISIEPGPIDAEVVCTLGYTTLHKDTHGRTYYEALSYCWGDIQNTFRVVLRCPSSKGNDLDSQHYTRTIYRITENLHDALRALRHPGKNRKLWVDAICVNQSDPHERTHQVGYMGNIYSLATSVLVWLGKADFESLVFIKAAACYGRVVRDNKRSGIDINFDANKAGILSEVLDRLPVEFAADEELMNFAHDFERLGYMRQLGFSLRAGFENYWLDMLPYVAYGLQEVVQRPWFEHVWVVQEVFLAPRDGSGQVLVDVVVGHAGSKWTDFCDFANHIIEASFLPRNFKSLGDLTRRADGFANGWLLLTEGLQATENEETALSLDILSIVLASRDFRSSDPRDKLFAILGLSNETREESLIAPMIQADYTKSIDQVLTDFTCWYLREIGSLRIFDFVGADHVQSAWYRPTWVPNILDLDEYLPFVHHEPDDRTERQRAEISLDLRKSLCLSIKGVTVAEIDRVMRDKIKLSEFGSYLSTTDTIYGRDVFEYLRTICQRRVQEPSDVEFYFQCLPMLGCRSETRREEFVAWMRKTRRWSRVSGMRGWGGYYISNAEVQSTDHFIDVLCGFCRERRVFLGSSGIAGLGPNAVEIGDVVVMFHGSRNQYLLRPHVESVPVVKLQYQFLGPCALYGDKWLDIDVTAYQDGRSIPTESFELI